MRTSEQVDKIAGALLAFQKEIAPPTKNKENPYFKSMYAELSPLKLWNKDCSSTS